MGEGGPLYTAVSSPLVLLFVAGVSVPPPQAPPMPSMVKSDAVGASSAASSSGVKSLGRRSARMGMRARMKTGKPTAAMVCVMAKVAPKPMSSRRTNHQILEVRLMDLKGAVGGVRCLSRQR